MKAKNSVFTFCTLVLVFLIMLMLIAFVTERKFVDKKVDNSAGENSSSVLDDGEIIIGEIDYFFEAKGVYGDFGFNDTVSVGLTKTGVSI